VRRLTGDEHLDPAFAATWPTYELEPKTRALLTYAAKLTDSPSTVDDADIAALRAADWGERGIYEATALVGLFNFTGRLEAASGLPPDQVPAGARFAEGRPDRPAMLRDLRPATVTETRPTSE
jgi:alkylhydroperoxidase family enzyme